METGTTVFAFVPDLATASGVYARLLQEGVSPEDISLLTHHEFAPGKPASLPALAPCRGGLVGNGPLVARTEGTGTVFELLSEALLGSAKRMGTIKAGLIMGETLMAVRALSPAVLDAARRTLDPTDGLAA